MADTITIPYDWLKDLDPSIIANDSIPISGFIPVFPWDQLTATLAKQLECPDLFIKPGMLTWRNHDALFEGLGPISLLKISVPPLNGYGYWAVAHGDILNLMNMLLHRDQAGEGIVNPEFLTGFYRFLATEVIHSFNKIDYDSTLLPHLLEEADNPSEVALCQDVHISVGEQTVIGRWVVPPELHRSLHERYAERTMTTPLNALLADKVTVTVALEAGRTTLRYQDVQALQPGDFITLDVCTYDPEEKKARVNLTINGHTIFRARFKQHELKILELPLYHEAEMTMDKNPLESHFDKHEDASNSSFEQDDENEEDDFTFDEEFSLTEDELEEKIYGETPSAESPTPTTPEPTTAEPETPAATQPEAEKKPFSAADLPLEIIIEAGRIKLPIHKLLDLQPGNVLELNIKPEDGVNLVVNGKCIGKGEFLRIGDVLGVRILDLGG